MDEQEFGESLYLDSDYVRKILEIKDNLKAILVGQDPYNDNALGIPFSVNNWNDLLKSGKGNSGRYLLESLTGKSHSELVEKYENPTICIKGYLLSQNIILLNSSYEFLKNCCCKKRARDKAYQFNKLFYAHSDKIFILGNKAQTSQRARNKRDGFEFIEIPHPNIQAKSSNREKWERYWSKGALKRIIEERE